MKKKSNFEEFAPAILKVYHRDKEEFWVAVMALFLASNISPPAWLSHLKVDLGLPEFLNRSQTWVVYEPALLMVIPKQEHSGWFYEQVD